MTAPELDLPSDFRLELGVAPPMTRGACAESVGMFLKTPVEGLTVKTTLLQMEVSSGKSGHLQLAIQRHTSGWVPPEAAMEQIYRVWQGLRDVGLEVTVNGPWAEHFQTKTKAHSTAPLEVPWLTEKIRSQKGRKPKPTPVSLATLESIHQVLTSTEPFSRLQHTAIFQREFPEHVPFVEVARELLLSHVSALKVILTLKDDRPASHCLMGHPVELTAAQQKSLLSLKRKVCPASATSSISQLTLAELARALDPDYEPFIWALTDELGDIEVGSDYGRYPRTQVAVPQMTLKNGQTCRWIPRPYTLRVLLDAGLPSATLHAMGVSPGCPMDDHTVFPDWFGAICGPHRLWGNNSNKHRVLVVEENPQVLYKL